MPQRLTPLRKRYAGFVLWGAVNGVVGAFGLVPMGEPLGNVWPWIPALALVSTSCAAVVFAFLIKRSLVLQGAGLLVVGILISPVLVLCWSLVQYLEFRGSDCGDCGLVMLVALFVFWVIYGVLGYISAVVYWWAMRKAGRI